MCILNHPHGRVVHSCRIVSLPFFRSRTDSSKMIGETYFSISHGDASVFLHSKSLIDCQLVQRVEGEHLCSSLCTLWCLVYQAFLVLCFLYWTKCLAGTNSLWIAECSLWKSRKSPFSDVLEKLWEDLELNKVLLRFLHEGSYALYCYMLFGIGQWKEWGWLLYRVISIRLRSCLILKAAVSNPFVK